ncbi:unnamed protein product [Dicrocoelium dendriticum]|nr:unnamed protein product [Dicrocoelium dendriticum]
MLVVSDQLPVKDVVYFINFLVLTGRNRSESPATRSKSRPSDASVPAHFDESSKYDLESLQKEIELRSGLLNFGSESISASMDDFINEGLLGSGTCSVVYKMRHRSKTDLVMAVKYMRRSSTCQEENKRIMMDLNVITKSCDCVYIVQCYGIFFTTGDVWICMEVMPTCLDKLLRDLHRPFPEKVLGKITVSITTALDYLKRRHNVMHRDVKPSNMLLSYQGVVKLCDFGISGKLKDSIARSRQLGCIGYMAPERLETPTYDVRADIWSLGISLLELATGSFPYKGTELEFAIMSKIISEPAPSLPHHIPFTSAFRYFVDCCLKKDPRQRPKYRSLMSTEFFCRHNVAPIDVLEWLRGLPLKHLHHPDSTKLLSVSPATSLGSPNSTSTLSPEMPRAIRGLTLDGSFEFASTEPKDTPMTSGFGVALVSAPNGCAVTSHIPLVSPTFLGTQTCSSNVLSSSTSNCLTSNSKAFISGGTQQHVHESLVQHPPAARTMVSTTVVDQAHDPSSQTSSGYGSANSDGSPGSFTSGSRPSSASQMSDVSTSDCCPMSHRPPLCSPLNGTLLRYPVAANRTQLLNTSEAVRVIDHHSNPSLDHWSASASSSRTTTNRVANHYANDHRRTAAGTVGPLIRKFEPEGTRSHKTTVKDRSCTPPVRARNKVDANLVSCSGGADHLPRQVRSPATFQNRSASVGAQLQRVCAQRWPSRPTLKNRIPVSDSRQTFVSDTRLGATNDYEKFAAAPAQPYSQRSCYSRLPQAQSTLDCRTPSQIRCVAFGGSNSPLLDDRCLEVPILPPLFPHGNRLTQRLFTHPLPRQSNTSRPHRCSSSNSNDPTSGINSHPSVIMAESLAKVRLNDNPVSSHSPHSPSSGSSNSRNMSVSTHPRDQHNRLNRRPPFETEL